MRSLILALAACIVGVSIYIAGCSETPVNVNGPNSHSNTGDLTCAEGVTYDLIYGQHDTCGTIHISNDADNIYVTYNLDPTCCANLGDLHLWIGTSLNDMPHTGQGAPIPGQFPYKVDGVTGTTYTFTIPWSELGIPDITERCDAQIFIVAHAASCGETGFGGNVGVNIESSGRWYYYAQYNICCENGTPGNPDCQTAFGKGGWVWTTAPNANPESLPTWQLTKNRWGWVINLTSTGTTTYQIWAGAGLNDTNNGTLVGTLTVNWNGTDVDVTYSMLAGYTLSEVHLYASDDRLRKNPAPGKFGNLAYFNPMVSSYTFNNIPLVDANGIEGVWIIAHAVVCGNY